MKFAVLAALCAAVLLPGCSILNWGAPEPAPLRAAVAAPAAPLAAPGARDPWCDSIANQERSRMIANSASPQTQNNIYNSSYATCVQNAAPPPR